MTEVFKVVTLRHDEPWSYTFRRQTYGIGYKLNEWVKPKIGYIFAFDTLANAKFYVQNDSDPKVKLYKALADEVIYPDVGNDWDLNIAEYWENYAKNKITPTGWLNDKFPNGTIWTNKLMLVEKLQ